MGDRFFLNLIIVLVFPSCFHPEKIKQSTNAGLQQADTLHISVKAIDLTEDISRVSSGNDELLVLVYSYKEDSAIVPSLLLSESFVLDSLVREKYFSVNCPAFSDNENRCLILIETDSDKNKEQTEPVVRVNLLALIKAWKNQNKETFAKFLGDDDLIGLSLLPAKGMKTGWKYEEIFSGNHLFDFYKYELNYNY